MEQIFENRYTQNKEMVREFAGKVAVLKFRRRAIWIGILGLLLLAVSVVNKNMLMAGVALACVIICFGVLLLMPSFFAKEIEKTGRNLNKGNQPESVITFGKKITITEGDARLEFSYEQIVKPVETTNLYCLMLGDSNGIIVRKDGFTRGTFEEFKEFIDEKCGRNR